MIKIMLAVVIPWGSIASMVVAQPTQSDQGTHLHGTGPYEHVNIELNQFAGCKYQFAKGNLQLVKGPGDLFSGDCSITKRPFLAPYNGGTVSFSIDAVRKHANILGSKANLKAPQPPANKYKVSVGPEKTPLCEGEGYALAVPFAWSTSGEILDTSDYFTFACVPTLTKGISKGGGVIAKCVDWGYPPWEDTSAYDAPTAKRFHQTCVRLATADYCGEGDANTVDGTPIGIADMDDAVDAGLVQINDMKVTFLPKPKPAVDIELEGIWG
ncbi:MAG TPA: ADYC domain-containing protein, partial [Myxococcaceae bacterium]